MQNILTPALLALAEPASSILEPSAAWREYLIQASYLAASRRTVGQSHPA